MHKKYTFVYYDIIDSGSVHICSSLLQACIQSLLLLYERVEVLADVPKGRTRFEYPQLHHGFITGCWCAREESDQQKMVVLSLLPLGHHTRRCTGPEINPSASYSF